MPPSPAANPGSDTRTDLELVDAMNGGDADAFESLYLRHREYATKIAMRFAGEREVALDAVQDSFIYFYKKFPGFKLTAKMTTFLYPVVKHNALAGKKKARRAQGDANEEVLGTLPQAGQASDPPTRTAPATSGPSSLPCPRPSRRC